MKIVVHAIILRSEKKKKKEKEKISIRVPIVSLGETIQLSRGDEKYNSDKQPYLLIGLTVFPGCVPQRKSIDYRDATCAHVPMLHTFSCNLPPRRGNFSKVARLLRNLCQQIFPIRFTAIFHDDDGASYYKRRARTLDFPAISPFRLVSNF